jgi:hypothetical protein
MIAEGVRSQRFFDDAMEKFSRLGRRTVERDFTVAGLTFRVMFAEGAVEHAFARGIAHLETERVAQPDLTLAVWDSESTGIEPLRAAWTVEDYGHSGVINGFNDSRYHTVAPYGPTPIFGMLDRDERRGIYWTRDARNLPYWELGAPFRPLLHEWLTGHGRVPAHGGAVGYEDGGVFLAGAGGSGKSNTALSCLRSDLLYASDDFCVLSEGPEWRVHSLYCTGKVLGKDLPRQPQLAAHVSNPDKLDEEKALFFLFEPFREKFIRSMPLKAALMPQVIGDGTSEIVPTSEAQALRAIAMSTIALSRWTGSTTFSAAARLVRALPCYTLRIGRDSDRVPELISDLLRGLR